jgi:hypothetical protein
MVHSPVEPSCSLPNSWTLTEQRLPSSSLHMSVDPSSNLRLPLSFLSITPTSALRALFHTLDSFACGDLPPRADRPAVFLTMQSFLSMASSLPPKLAPSAQRPALFHLSCIFSCDNLPPSGRDSRSLPSSVGPQRLFLPVQSFSSGNHPASAELLAHLQPVQAFQQFFSCSVL